MSQAVCHQVSMFFILNCDLICHTPWPSLGAGHDGKDMVAGAQPKEMTWHHLLVGSLPAGGAKRVRFKESWVAAKGRDLGC